MSKQSPKSPKKRKAEKLQDSGAEVKEKDYLFSTEDLTEIEKRRLNHKRILRDAEEDERKSTCHMEEEKTRKVRHT